MLKFGFEREYFVRSVEDAIVLPPMGMPNDGVLAEARGKPSKDPVDAVFSLLAEEHRMIGLLPKGHRLELIPVAAVSRELRIECARHHTKGLVHYQNLYGHQRHRNKQSQMTAGLHVSVTRSTAVTVRTTPPCDACGRYEDEHSLDVNTVFDFAAFIRMMDLEYLDTIKGSARRPGFYEIKQDGRVEYRSLPNNVDVVAVGDFIKKQVKAIHGSW